VVYLHLLSFKIFLMHQKIWIKYIFHIVAP
jgi:hypothetical protein